MTRLARAPAKVVAPVAAGLVRRPRLFRLLERGSRGTWLCGPPGSGKTALAASYLELPRRAGGWYQLDERDVDLATFFHYMGLLARRIAPGARPPLPAFTAAFRSGVPAFTRRFFETFFQRCPRHFVLVLDDFDTVPVSAPLGEILTELFGAAPPGCRVLVVSREEPPPSVARLRATGALGVVGWEDLRFTSGEIRQLARGAAGHRRLGADVEMLAARSQGWAAGAVLLLDGATRTAATAIAGDPAQPQAVFDYFMGEVLAALSPADRQALFAMSLLPTISASAAVELTEHPDAPQLLDRLSRRHSFVERREADGTVYRFHPMFQQCLRAQAATGLTAEIRQRVLRTGAAHLVERGQAEEAAELLLSAGEWKLVEQLVVEHAPGLVRAGRGSLAGSWLDQMPGDIVTASPWLAYWRGVTGMARGFAFTREHLARAASGFEQSGDRA